MIPPLPGAHFCSFKIGFFPGEADGSSIDVLGCATEWTCLLGSIRQISTVVLWKSGSQGRRGASFFAFYTGEVTMIHNGVVDTFLVLFFVLSKGDITLLITFVN